MPTISETMQAMVRRIAGAFDDNLSGTLSGTHSTTQAQMTGEPAQRGANSLQGSEITVVKASDNTTQTSRITAHTVAAGTATLTTVFSSIPSNGDSYEIHNINGRGFVRQRYIDAINAAIDSRADLMWTDTDTVALASELGYGIGQSVIGGRRSEYPLPSGLNYIFGVDFLGVSPMTRHGIGNLRTTRALGDAGARTRLGQGFKVQQDSFIGYIAVFMGNVGSPTDNLTCVVETDSSGLPSGTAVTNGTSGTVVATGLQTRMRYVVFAFNPPILATGGTQYHLTLRRSGATSGTNYFAVGEDNAGSYGYGSLMLYDGATWTAVTASDLIFAVSTTGSIWIPYARANYEYLPATTDQLRIAKLPDEGTPIRIRGGTAIARVSAETDSIPIDPDYCFEFAKSVLLRGRVGRQAVDDYGRGEAAALQGLSTVPPRTRTWPANTIRVR